MSYQSAYTGAQIDEAVSKAKALPGKAVAGQFLSVKAIDESGKPTEFETVDVWSDERRDATVQDVLAALPTWTGGDF